MMEADDYSNLREQILSASHGEPTVIKSYRLNIRGQRRWHKILARPLWSGEDLDEIIGIIGKCIDVHDELTEVNSLKQVASTDELTGLYRREFARRKITETLAEDTEAEKRFALILFDLDMCLEIRCCAQWRIGCRRSFGTPMLSPGQAVTNL